MHIRQYQNGVCSILFISGVLYVYIYIYTYVQDIMCECLVVFYVLPWVFNSILKAYGALCHLNHWCRRCQGPCHRLHTLHDWNQTRFTTIFFKKSLLRFIYPSFLRKTRPRFFQVLPDNSQPFPQSITAAQSLVETVGDFLGEPGRTWADLGGPGQTWGTEINLMFNVMLKISKADWAILS